MHFQQIEIKTLVLLLSVTVSVLTGCESMQATNSGFLTEYHSPSSLKESVIVTWKAEGDSNLIDDEQTLLTSFFKAELEKSLDSANLDLSSIQLSAAITRVETVSPALNWILTLALIGPMNRGGAAVEFKAINTKTAELITQLQFAQWTPISEFSARYQRLKPAQLALNSAAEHFVKLLKSKMKTTQPTATNGAKL